MLVLHSFIFWVAHFKSKRFFLEKLFYVCLSKLSKNSEERCAVNNIRFPMIITCFVKNPKKIADIFEKLLRDMGYVKIGERAFVHQGGEQLTAAITFGKTYLPEIDSVKDCLTLYLSDAEHAINIEICHELNKILTSEITIGTSFYQ